MRKIFPGNEKKAGVTGDSLLSAAMTALVDEPVTARLSFNRIAFQNPLPSIYPIDLLFGLACGAAVRLAVYLKGKNAKKYRHNVEYGSARWGTQKDIEPFEDPVFENNVILTQTERLMMGNRPKNPANARNKKAHGQPGPLPHLQHSP